MKNTGGSLVARWRQAKRLIDENIESWLRQLPESEAIEAARYIARGGKRLRGFIVVELAEELGAEIGEALDAAVAVELVHASSLALDDIIDEDLTRRGMEAAWVRYGLKKTVMVSNLLIPFAQLIVDRKYGAEALRRTVSAWLDISRGEVLDAFREPAGLGSDAYLEMIRLKTGALFRLSTELGVIAAKRFDLLHDAAKLGEVLGMMYQIADDIKDSRDPNKVEKEPSLQLFKKWAPSEGYAINYIRRLLADAESLAEKLVGSGSYSFREIPRFIVRAMLGDII